MMRMIKLVSSERYKLLCHDFETSPTPALQNQSPSYLLLRLLGSVEVMWSSCPDKLLAANVGLYKLIEDEGTEEAEKENEEKKEKV